jgi:3-hydroxyacyl-[acyl-carrier-protein] dehydratase
MTWDKDKIKSILPQREPFLFIDEVVEIEGTEKVVAVKHVLPQENYFQGHFPGNPVMPGVLILEAMAQTAIVLYALIKPDVAQSKPTFFLGKSKVEFFSPVVPGDDLFLEVTPVKLASNAGIVDAKARVKDKIVAKAELVFGIK